MPSSKETASNGVWTLKQIGDKPFPSGGINMPYDLFFSYRRHDLDRARPLLDALASCGLCVFRDETIIDEGASITQEIREGIASSKLLLAFYSSTYPLSGPCQEEIISAWLAAQHAGELPQARVRIINPEPGFDHIPAPLRDLQAPLPREPAKLTALAGALRVHLDSLESGLSAVAQPALLEYHGMAPVHAPHFVGRVHELWELHAKLTANRIGLISGVYGQGAAQVRGLGGNGKSLLAREYALRFGPAYPGGVFWLNAYGHDDSKGALDEEGRLATRQDQLRQFAVKLGLATEGLKPQEIEAAFWRQLEARGIWRQACLWIVDDVPSGIAPSSLERYWFAPGSNVSTLITTRSREYGSVGQQLDLGVLSPEEAITLLTRSHRPENAAEEAAAQKITEELGYHPLAVEVAGSYLAKVGIGFREYLNELTDPKQDVLEIGALLRESLPTGHDRSITGTLLKSLQLLGEEGRDFLRLASVLAVAPIARSFLQDVFEAVGVEKGIPETVLEALDQADSLSLCEEASHDSRLVHSLVSRVVRFKLADSDRIEQLRKAAVDVLCWRLSVAGDVREHPGIANEVAHGRHLTATGLVNENDATLAGWIARHDYARGEYSLARKLGEQALQARGRLLGKEHPDTLEAMLNLAQTLEAQGDLAGARKLGEQALEASVRLLGKEDPHTLMATNNLAGTLQAQGDLTGARKLQEQVLEARGRLLGKEHPDTLRAMNNLAGTLQAQGDLAGARKLQEQVLEARGQLLGKEHPDTLAAMNNLAQTLSAQGDPAGARQLQEQVLEARVRLLGKDHPHTLAAMLNLAGTVSAQGDLAGARRARKPREALERLFGKVLASILASGDFRTEGVHRAHVPGEPECSPVDCTVFAPDRVEREGTGLLQAFLHAPEARREAEAAAKQFDPKATERGYRSLVLDAPIGTTFAFDVEIEGFVFDERRDTLLWTGQPQAATFRFDVPKGCKLGQHTGTVRISQNGIPVGRITFQIEVVLDARDARERPVGKEARHYRACFCSYSSLDRAEMLKRAQGLRATGLQTFIDVLTLRPGDIWNPKIFEAIEESDLFVVIWSKNARDSKWVKKESRYALRHYKEHGSPDFVPIPVEGPPIASVPRGLQAYHFNDELLGQIRAAELEMQARKKKEEEKPGR
jgi:TIR domain/Tetratricopeptide repeat